MITRIVTFLLILLTSCAIEEIPRQPLLASPLGLKVKLAPASVGPTPPPGAPTTGMGMFFTANNPEIYFTGFSIFVSTRRADFQDFPEGGVFFPLIPIDVPGNEARLLTNYSPVNDNNLTVFKGGQMAFPERDFYPPPRRIVNGESIEDLGIDQESPEDDPEFTFTTFVNLPPTEAEPTGTPFVVGTTYYFGVYAYSSVDNAYSLPSNIFEITFVNLVP